MLHSLWLLVTLLLEPANDETPDVEDTPEADDEQEIRDPEKHALSQEAKMWRLRFRKAEQRVKELEDGAPNTGAALTLHRENAFLHAVLAADRPVAVEDAWDLMNAKGFVDLLKVSDEGEVTGLEEAMEKLLSRYPWLVEEDTHGDAMPLPHSGGRARKKPAPQKPGSVQLQDRFPALRGRR